MNNTTSDAMLAHLHEVDAERARRLAQPCMGACVEALKSYQQRRFASTYADLLQAPRYAMATRFFLEELYGPGDFSRRDAQFARVVPSLTRLFPSEVVATVARLARLHAVSERLDSAMGELLLPGAAVNAWTYAKAWQACGEPTLRQLQIDLTIEVGEALERLTRKPLLRQALHLMRSPANLAGIGELQSFLESGFDTFRAMRGAGEFLQTVRSREQTLARALFDADLSGSCPTGDAALGQLP